MSKLEELIQQYCPDGVEYKPINETTDMKRGTSLTKQNAIEGDIPVISGGREPAFYHNKANREGAVVTVAGSGAGAGYVQYFETPIFANDCFTLQGKEGVSTKYIYYYLSNMQERISATKKGGGVPHVHISDIENFEIPVPPLPVQEEIVRILDKFTELEQELEQELELRKKQYEYYRDKMLSLSDYDGEVEWKPLGVICTIVRGASPRPIKKYVTDDKINGVHWIKIGDASPESKYIDDTNEYITQEGAKHSRFVKKGSFILSNSMSFGRPYILNIDGCIHDGWLSLSDFESDVLPDYLYHVLMSGDLQLEMRRKAGDGGCVSNLNSDIVKNIKIPIIDKTQQRKIVCLLDRFNKLTSDISEGLPAEIKMRHQQYEYYRDKLLNFKRLEVV